MQCEKKVHLGPLKCITETSAVLQAKLQTTTKTKIIQTILLHFIQNMLDMLITYNLKFKLE